MVFDAKIDGKYYADIQINIYWSRLVPHLRDFAVISGPSMARCWPLRVEHWFLGLDDQAVDEWNLDESG